MINEPVIRVAFADDHLLVRKGIISLLQTVGGIEVDIEVSNGQELIEELKKARQLPDVCIIDINMPVMDGYTLLQEIRKRWPKMKTLVLSAFNSELYVIRMMQAGANGYLLKSSDIDEVKEALISIHTNGYYYSSTANKTIFFLAQTKTLKTSGLTEAELELLKYCCTELTYAQIAQKMNTTLSSVEGCRDRMCAKLNLTSRIELALFAIQFGVVTLDVNPSGESILFQK